MFECLSVWVKSVFQWNPYFEIPCSHASVFTCYRIHNSWSLTYIRQVKGCHVALLLSTSFRWDMFRDVYLLQYLYRYVCRSVRVYNPNDGIIWPDCVINYIVTLHCKHTLYPHKLYVISAVFTYMIIQMPVSHWFLFPSAFLWMEDFFGSFTHLISD